MLNKISESESESQCKRKLEEQLVKKYNHDSKQLVNLLLKPY